MRCSSHIIFLFVIVGLYVLATGCRSEGKADFVMNERSFPSVDGMSWDKIDSTSIYTIYEGDSIVFKDVSVPEKEDRPRFWNLDGYPGWEERDSKLVVYPYGSVNRFTVVLCIGDTLNCTEKAVVVKEAIGTPPPVIVDTPKPPKSPQPTEPPKPSSPRVKFILPNVYSTNSPTDHFTIHANVWNAQKSDMYLEVNGEEYKSFTLKGNKFTSSVPLKPGKNLVKLKVSNSVGSIDEEREFVYSPNAKPAPMLGFVQPSGNGTTVNSDKFDIVVSTANIDRKDQLTLTVGGQAIKNFSFSPSASELTATVTLAAGNNTIRVAANTSDGKTSQEATINYVKKAVNTGFSKSGVVGVPVLNYPAGDDCVDRSKGGFSATLSPNSDMELTSFKIFTDVCGGVKVELTGPNLKSHFQTAINAGKTQISLADIDARLEAGNKYTLTLTPIAGYGTCSSSQTPSFNDVQSCSGVNSNTSPALKLDQKGKLVLFDLKFSY